MQQKVHLLNVNNIGQNMGEKYTVIHCLTDCDTTNVLMSKYHGKVVPIKLIENPPLVHQHSKQGRETKNCSWHSSVR